MEDLELTVVRIERRITDEGEPCVDVILYPVGGQKGLVVIVRGLRGAEPILRSTMQLTTQASSNNI